ncbi:MAG: hypothetical protein ABI806_14345, partial [Candidatus Solibacter sp.]
AAHADHPAAAHFTAVRSRVIAELERQARPWWQRSWVCGCTAALAAILVLVAIWPRGPAPTAPRILASIPAAPPAPEVRNVATAPSRSRLRSEPRASASGPHEPLTIKLQTTDPNIVIYWIAD